MRNARLIPLLLAILMLTTSAPLVAGQSTDPTAHSDPATVVANATGNPRPNTALIGLVPEGREETPWGQHDLQAYPDTLARCLPNWYSESHQGNLPTSRCPGGHAKGGKNDAVEIGQYQRLWSWPDKYYCGSGLPVGGVDPTNATQTHGPIGYYAMDAIITQGLSWGLNGLVGINDNMLNRSNNQTADYYYGEGLQFASFNMSETHPPVSESVVVMLYCEVPDASSPTGFDSHPTQVLPQNFTYQIDPSTGQYHKVWSSATRGIFGFYDHGSSTGGNPAVKFSQFTFLGDCNDNSIIWKADTTDPSAPKTCEQYPGAQVLTTGWYWSQTWLGQIQEPVETVWGYQVQRFELNPVLSSVFPQFYNTVFEDQQIKCELNGGSGAFHECGPNPAWLQRAEFPAPLTSDVKPAPVAEDIEVIGNGVGHAQARPALFEAYGDASAVEGCTVPNFDRWCKVTQAPTVSAFGDNALEPDFPNATGEQSVLTQSGSFAQAPVLAKWGDGWTLTLDVQKRNIAMPSTFFSSGFDPIYGTSGQNKTQSCTYHEQAGTQAPDNATGTNPCNRRDVWPAGFTLVATFAFEDANGQYVDNQVDSRLKQEYLGLPDVTTLDGKTYNIADVGSLNGGNDVSFDVPGGFVIRVNSTCDPNPGTPVVDTGNLNVNLYPARYDPNRPVSLTEPIPEMAGWVSTPSEVQQENVAYGTSLPASNPDIAACNPNGNATAGWGTFTGSSNAQDADWFDNGAGHYSSNVEYIVPSGTVGLVRTHVTAQIHVPNTAKGLASFPVLANNPMAASLLPGHTYTLSDVDYYGTGTLGN